MTNDQSVAMANTSTGATAWSVGIMRIKALRWLRRGDRVVAGQHQLGGQYDQRLR